VLRLEESGLFRVVYRRAREQLLFEDRTKGWVKRWLDAELVIEACRNDQAAQRGPEPRIW
jgi:hypothetical protein